LAAIRASTSERRCARRVVTPRHDGHPAVERGDLAGDAAGLDLGLGDRARAVADSGHDETDGRDGGRDDGRRGDGVHGVTKAAANHILTPKGE